MSRVYGAYPMGCLRIYTSRYLLSAQRWHVVDPKELNMLWKTHKPFNQCKAKKFEPKKRK